MTGVDVSEVGGGEAGVPVEAGESAGIAIERCNSSCIFAINTVTDGFVLILIHRRVQSQKQPRNRERQDGKKAGEKRGWRKKNGERWGDGIVAVVVVAVGIGGDQRGGVTAGDRDPRNRRTPLRLVR